MTALDLVVDVTAGTLFDSAVRYDTRSLPALYSVSASVATLSFSAQVYFLFGV